MSRGFGWRTAILQIEETIGSVQSNFPGPLKRSVVEKMDDME
jgi:hypothetical protein